MLDETYEEAGAVPPARYFRPESGFFSGTMRKVLTWLGDRLVLPEMKRLG